MIKARRYKLSDVNGMDEKTFVSVFGAVFEESAWAAQMAWSKAPFESTGDLLDAMYQSVNNTDQSTQKTLLCAHPELGTNRKMTESSVNEQTGAGIRNKDDEFRNLLDDLNTDYREKFDFPFIIAVKGLTPDLIIEHLQRRLQNDRDTEFKECLAQVFKIAKFRLDDLLILD